MPGRCAPGPLGFAGKAGVQVEAQALHGERRARSLWRPRCRANSGIGQALDRLADAASRLREARVYCLGLRSCHAAAWHFHYMLSLLGDKTVMLDDAGGTGLDAIRDAGTPTPCWSPASSRMPRATIEGARYAADRGVPVVALTDSEPPLAQIAANTILVATGSPSFLHTMTPLLAVAWPRWSPAAAAPRRWLRSSIPRRSSLPSAFTCRAATDADHVLFRTARVPRVHERGARDARGPETLRPFA